MNAWRLYRQSSTALSVLNSIDPLIQKFCHAGRDWRLLSSEVMTASYKNLLLDTITSNVYDSPSEYWGFITGSLSFSEMHLWYGNMRTNKRGSISLQERFSNIMTQCKGLGSLINTMDIKNSPLKPGNKYIGPALFARAILQQDSSRFPGARIVPYSYDIRLNDTLCGVHYAESISLLQEYLACSDNIDGASAITIWFIVLGLAWSSNYLSNIRGEAYRTYEADMAMHMTAIKSCMDVINSRSSNEKLRDEILELYRKFEYTIVYGM